MPTRKYSQQYKQRYRRKSSRKPRRTRRQRPYKTRKHTKNPKYTRRHMNGGEKIAQGTYGCVYNPPLRCKGSDERPPYTISKFLNKRNAEKEYDEYQVMFRIDPLYRFHLGIKDICVPEEPDPTMNEDFREDCSHIWKENTSLEDYRILIEPDGGFEFDDIRHNLSFTRKRPKTSIHAEKWNTLFHGMERMFYGLVKMKKNGYVHQDIKGDNIVVDSNTFHFNYIDFGMLAERTYIIQTILKGQPTKYRFDKLDFFKYYPPELFVLSNYQERYKSLMRLSITQPENAVRRYEQLKEEYHTRLSTSENKHTKRVREDEVEDLDVPYRRSQFRFPETLDEYLKAYSSSKLNEMLEKWDVFSIGYMMTSLWRTYFKQPFTEDIIPSHKKHPFMALRTMIANMIGLDYRTRASPEEVYAMFREAYQSVFDRLLHPIDPSLRMYPPLLDRGTFSASTTSSSASSASSGSSSPSASLSIAKRPSRKSHKSRKSHTTPQTSVGKRTKSKKSTKLASVSIPVGRIEQPPRQSGKESYKTIHIEERLPQFSAITKQPSTRKPTRKSTRKPTRPTRKSPPMTRNRLRRLGLQLDQYAK